MESMIDDDDMTVGFLIKILFFFDAKKSRNFPDTDDYYRQKQSRNVTQM